MLTSVQNMQEKEIKEEIRWEDDLDINSSLSNIEILRANGISPFLFPVKFGRNVGPKSGRVLNGPSIKLKILHRRKIITTRSYNSKMETKRQETNLLRRRDKGLSREILTRNDKIILLGSKHLSENNRI